jgi:hypothetical protein
MQLFFLPKYFLENVFSFQDISIKHALPIDPNVELNAR